MSVCPQSEFCSDKPKSGAKYGLPELLAILTEMGEVTDGVMDSKVSKGGDLCCGLLTTVGTLSLGYCRVVSYCL